MPRPTTSKPVMAPPRKAICSASFKPVRAASAVRTLARTETFMPMAPAAPERIAPMAKPMAVALSRKIAITINNTRPTAPMVLY